MQQPSDINISICLIESPLQLISATPFILRNKNVYILFNTRSTQISNILNRGFKINRNNIFGYTNSLELIYLIFKIKYNKTIINFLMGDIRYLNNIIFFTFFRKAFFTLVDDGNFNMLLDNKSFHEANIRFLQMKKIFFKIMLKQPISRETVLNHSITKKYTKIIRNDFKNIIENMALTKDITFPINEKAVYYIESPLDALISKSDEENVYKKLSGYANELNLKLKSIAHRVSDINSIKDLTKDYKNIEIIKLDLPIEFYINNISHDKYVVFGITTAIFTCSMIMNKRSIPFKVLDLSNYSINRDWKVFHNKFQNDLEMLDDNGIEIEFF